MKRTARAMTRKRSAPIVAPTIIAIFLLLLRPVVEVEGVGEVGDGCGVVGLEVAV